jgi:hypothetical protein
MFVSRPPNHGGITSSISGRAGIIRICTSARPIAALVPMPLRRPLRIGLHGWSLPGRIDFTSPSCGTLASGLASMRRFPSMSASTRFATTLGSRCNGNAHCSSQFSGSQRHLVAHSVGTGGRRAGCGRSLVLRPPVIGAGRRYLRRTPAMAQRLSDHVWCWRDCLTTPAHVSS